VAREAKAGRQHRRLGRAEARQLASAQVRQAPQAQRRAGKVEPQVLVELRREAEAVEGQVEAGVTLAAGAAAMEAGAGRDADLEDRAADREDARVAEAQVDRTSEAREIM